MLVVGVLVAFGVGRSHEISAVGIQRAVLALGGFGLVAYLMAAAARPLLVVISGSLFSIAAGLVWGVWGGVFIAATGTLLSSSLVYALARRLGSPAVRELAGARFLAFEAMARRRGFAFVFVATLGFLLPADLVIAVAAVTGMRVRTVLAAASLGTLPGTVLMVSIGASVVRPSPLLWWLGGGAVLALTLLAVLLARAWFPAAAAETRSTP